MLQRVANVVAVALCAAAVACSDDSPPPRTGSDAWVELSDAATHAGDRDAGTAGGAAGTMAQAGGGGTAPIDARTKFYCELRAPERAARPAPVVYSEPAATDRFADAFGPVDFGLAWTGEALLVWGGDQLGSLECPGSVQRGSDAGSIYDPVTRSWSPMTRVGAPQGRHQPQLVWTGNQMLVWGGFDDPIDTLSSGGIYDPEADTWSSMSNEGAPPRGCRAVSAWGNDRMLVWLGEGEGYGYEPEADRWSRMSSAGAPRGGRVNAAWTGLELITVNTINFTQVNVNDVLRTDGYDPERDSWRALAPPPFHVTNHRAIWTGAHVLLFGFEQSALYDPCADEWQVLSAQPPAALAYYMTLWAGSELVIWGAAAGATDIVAYRFDPYLDEWHDETEIDRWLGAAWTGSEILIPQHHPF